MNIRALNLPNRLTLLRILLIAPYLVLASLEAPVCRWLAAAVFSAAALTDLLDGALARRRGEVTDLGKFMDPIADKLLALLPLILFASREGGGHVWAVLLMAARETIVSGFRLVAAGKGVVIAAGRSGKVKTTVQLAAVLMLTLRVPLAWWAVWLATALALYSGGEILLRHGRLLREDS